MELNLVEMLLRSSFAFFAILLLARIIGKKQLSQLTFFHYVTGITFGSIAAEVSTQVTTPFLDGLVSLIWWSVLTLLVSFISLKSKKARVSEEWLLKKLAKKNIHDIEQVYYVQILENGSLYISIKNASPPS